MVDYKLWPHQKTIIEKAKNLNYFAIFAEVGTGKTLTTIELLRYHYNKNKRVMKTLIVSPLIVTRNWVSEIEKFTNVPKEKYIRLEGSIAQRAKQLEKHNGIAVVNYDSFVNKDFTKTVIEWKPEIIVLDESHLCGNHSAQRTKALLKVSESMDKNGIRYILTGTPISSNQLNLWSQFYFLDHGKTLGSNFWAFRSNYFYAISTMNQSTYKPINIFKPRPGIDKILKEKISPITAVVKKQDCLELPPLVEVKIDVEMTPEQSRLYKEMKRDFITFMGDKTVVASIALTKLLRLQQIASGFIKFEDGTTQSIPNNRTKALADLLELIPPTQKVIVWSVFHDNYKAIAKVCQDLKIPFKEVHGLIPDAEKHINLEAFKTDPTIRVLIGSPQAMGVGLNITEASYSIWYSRNFSLVQDEQASARNYRPGSEKHTKITRFDLVCPNTVDSLALEAIKNKQDIAQRILSIPLDTL